jgi:hypothetical protein
MSVALAACGTATPRPAGIATRPAPFPTVGLERVMGQDAAALTRLFGQPDADVREGPGRKLQFVGRFCVLDAYLYPAKAAEPRVTWVDTREPDGSGIDRASCVAALTRREGGK